MEVVHVGAKTEAEVDYPREGEPVTSKRLEVNTGSHGIVDRQLGGRLKTKRTPWAEGCYIQHPAPQIQLPRMRQRGKGDCG